MKPKVAVLMSGGVDSSTAAYLLVKRGYEVVGVTLKLWDCGKLTETQRQLCCSPQDIYDVKNICSQLGIKHYVLDLSKEFETAVVENFCKKYTAGYTPNPCVICNQKIKFGIAFDKIRNMMDIKFLATGHYARVTKYNGKFYIKKAKDESKDQSYFLCTVPKEVIPYLIFPLGELTKQDVRKIAYDVGLKVAHKRESFDICFIPDRDYKNFLKIKGYEVFKKGKILEVHTGKFLGYHKGYMCYTIGQRDGLGLKNLSSRMYVVKIEPETNTIYVGTEDDLYRCEFIIINPVFYATPQNLVKKKLYVKVRYKSQLTASKIEILDKEVKVNLLQPQKAVTKGQYAAVYDTAGRIVLGGEIEFKN